MFRGYVANGGVDRGVLKLDQALALLAQKMFVLGIAVVVIVIGVGPHFELPQ